MTQATAGSRYKIVPLAASAALSAVPCRVMAIQAKGAGADWLIELTNDADGNGTNVLEVEGEAEGGQTFFDYSNLGGVWFSSKCYAAITDTNGNFFFWIDV